MTADDNPTLSVGIGAAHNYARWVAASAREVIGDRILEIGLGEGNFFGHLSVDHAYVGIDNHPPTIDRLRHLYPQRDYRVIDGMDPSLSRILGDPFDTIICCNVLEHIRDDVAFLRNIGSVATEGGRLFLFVPAFQWLFGDMDRLAGHFRRYSRHDLVNVVNASGWHVDDVRFFNPVGVATWYLQGLGNTQSLNSPSVTRRIRIFDRYLVPISRALDPLARGLGGQSLIVKATWSG